MANDVHRDSLLIHLQNLSDASSASDIRRFLFTVSIPPAGVHVIGGKGGHAFITVSTAEDAVEVLRFDGKILADRKLQLSLSNEAKRVAVLDMVRDEIGAPSPIFAAFNDQIRTKQLSMNDEKLPLKKRRSVLSLELNDGLSTKMATATIVRSETTATVTTTTTTAVSSTIEPAVCPVTDARQLLQATAAAHSSTRLQKQTTIEAGARRMNNGQWLPMAPVSLLSLPPLEPPPPPPPNACWTRLVVPTTLNGSGDWGPFSDVPHALKCERVDRDFDFHQLMEFLGIGDFQVTPTDTEGVVYLYFTYADDCEAFLNYVSDGRSAEGYLPTLCEPGFDCVYQESDGEYEGFKRRLVGNRIQLTRHPKKQKQSVFERLGARPIRFQHQNYANEWQPRYDNAAGTSTDTISDDSEQFPKYRGAPSYHQGPINGSWFTERCEFW